MKNFPHKIFLFFFFFLASKTFQAQDVKVSAVLDSSKIRIGEQVRLDLYVSYQANQKGVKIQWPSIGDTITGKIEVISVSPIDTTFPDKTNSSKIFQHQQITVSAYDSGYFAIPGFKFVIDNDSTHALYTESFLLEVHTVPTDTSAKKLKDIKPPFDEKFNWRWYTNYIYGGLALLLLTIIVIIVTVYYTRRKKQIVIEPEKPRIPAHITALATLEQIKQAEVWKEEKVKEYYSSISDAIRLYIEERFNVNALESTTDEIMLAFRSQVVDSVSKEKLQQLLMLSDLVKFAKQFPIENEHIFTLQNAFDFVNGTKREEEMPAADFSNSPPVQNTAGQNDAANSGTTFQQTPQIVTGNKTTSVSNPSTITTSEPSQNDGQDKKAKRKQILKISIGLGVMLLIYVTIQILRHSDPIDKMLMKEATAMSDKCPMMVDKDTRLDNVIALPDHVIQYNCTLVNLTSTDIDVNVAKSKLEPIIFEQLRTNPDVKEFRDNKVTIEYNYKDKTGKFLFNIKVTPNDYNTSI